jgi:hypothetical protein
MKKNGTREGKGRLNIWLEKSTIDQLRTESRSRSVPMQRIAETALAERYSPQSREDQMSVILRRLNRLDARMQVLERLAEVQAELAAIFARFYFAYTPEIFESQKDASWRQSQTRYDCYLKFLTKRLRENQTVLTELPQDVVLRGKDYDKER